MKKNKFSENDSRKALPKVNLPKDIRDRITMLITISVVSITVIIAIIVIIDQFYGRRDVNEDSGLNFISKTLLPLWATWIGTVLAFYFGKANFDSATKSYESIIHNLSPDEKLAKMPVSKVMIPFEKMVIMNLESSMSLTLQNILDDESFKLYNRYAFIGEKQVLKYIIHRRNFHQYLAEHIEESLTGKDPRNTLFKKYLEECTSPENRGKEWIGEDLYISISDNLLTAGKIISSRRNVRDVFVTANGRKGETLLGLITDEDILKTIKE